MGVVGGPKISRDSIDIAIDPSSLRSVQSSAQTNLLDYSTWIPGNTSATGFGRNGAAGDNIIELGTGPFGESAVLWASRNNDVDSNADGGWNGSRFPVDNQYMYRFSVWVYREINGNGSFYLGTRGYNSVNSNEGVLTRSANGNSTNPYFWSGGLSSTDGWQLVVGHVWPANSGTGANHIESGRYKVSTGKFANISNDWVMKTTTTSLLHRSYLYYSTDPNTVQLWAYPRVDKIDGTEPSIDELLGGNTRTAKNLTNRSQTFFLANNLRSRTDTGLSNSNIQSFQMDGTNTYIKIDGEVHTSLKRTVEIVFKANSQPSTYNPIATYTNETSISNNKRIWIGLQSGKVQMHGWGTNDPAGTTTISNGKYYHVIYAYDQTTKVHYLYINGNLERQLTNTEAGMTGWSNSSTERWYVGSDPINTLWTAGAGKHFNGDIGIFKTYNRVLTSKQVKQNYRAYKKRFKL